MRQKIEDIAIVGISCRFPGAKDHREYWENLVNGKESLTTFQKEDINDLNHDDPRLTEDYVCRAPLLEDIDLFDNQFFGFTPKEAENTDPQFRLLLEAAWNVIEDAGYGPKQLDKCGVFVSGLHGMYQIINKLTASDINHLMYQSHDYHQNHVDHLSTAISYRLGLKGPSFTVQSYCSSSLLSVYLARQSLILGESNVAIAGGSSLMIPQKQGHNYVKNGIYSQDGYCRPFDQNSTGTVFGSGVGLVMLKRLSDAIRDNDNIYSIIKSVAVNNDGSNKMSFYSPVVSGQAAVIKDAIRKSNVNPENITYVETHGSATEVGDRIELAALNKAFGSFTKKRKFCGLGSVKSNIGHLMPAAGIAGLIKVALSLKHGKLPPSININNPIRKFDFENSSFYLNTALQDWRPEKGEALAAGISSFGFGGTNVHAILQEHQFREQQYTKTDLPELITLSGKSEKATKQLMDQLEHFTSENPSSSINDIAYTLNIGREVHPYRSFLLANNPFSKDWERGTFNHHTSEDSKIVFMFPGQGSQHLDMAREVFNRCKIFRDYMFECADIYRSLTDKDLIGLLYPTESSGKQASIDNTDNAQPLIFSISYSLARLWMTWGVIPDVLIGHSVGELVAACIAGVFSLRDALDLVICRGEKMQSLAAGTMLSAKLKCDDINDYLTDGVELAVINSKELLVFSGETEAIVSLSNQLIAQGVSNQKLKTSHAFHSHMMDPVLPALGDKLSQVTLNEPKIPIMSTVTASWLTDHESISVEHWLKNTRQPVLFSDALDEIPTDNYIFLEVGPGNILNSLAKLNGKPTSYASLPNERDKTGSYSHLLRTLGELWTQGVGIDWSAYYGNENYKRVSLPTYPFERKKFWIERNSERNSEKNGEPFNIKKSNDIKDWLYVPFWKEVKYNQYSDFNPNITFLLFHNGNEIARQIEAKLRDYNTKVVSITTSVAYRSFSEYKFSIDILNPKHYKRLLEECIIGDNQKVIVIHQLTLGLKSENEILKYGFYGLITLSRALDQKYLYEVQINVLSNSVFDVDANDEILPVKSSIVGATKVIQQELPSIKCRYIDVNPGSLRLKALLSLILFKSDYSEFSLRGSKVWVREIEKLGDVNTNTVDIEGKNILVIGGFGTIGYALSSYLATFKCNLIIASRATVSSYDNPNKNITPKAKKLYELKQHAAEVKAFKVDINDRKSLSLLKRQMEHEVGDIDGIFYAAGAFDNDTFATLDEIKQGDLEMFYNKKIPGLYHIAELFQNTSVQFCTVISSISSLLGGLGYSKYASTHLVIDSFILKQNKASSFEWSCFNIDEWESSHTESGVKIKSSGIRDLRIRGDEGFKLFELLLKFKSLPQIYVSTGSLARRMEQWIRGHHDTNEVKPAEQVIKSESIDKKEIAEFLSSVWTELLGIEQISENDNFIELGGHSLIGVSMLSKIKKQYPKSQISLRQIIENPTIKGLSEEVVKFYLQET